MSEVIGKACIVLVIGLAFVWAWGSLLERIYL